ncbi:hypothetical protein [Salinisphaera orenii]|uniref:hypothetical protein n=1 Tax=Salinisphaera orenii TaxID=856731 RepID=UPI000F4BCB62|nr:hypothetical protein [Salinisphaera orenii]
MAERCDLFKRRTDGPIDASDNVWLYFTAFGLRLAQWSSLFYILFAAYSTFQDGTWPFSLRAETRLVSVELDGNKPTRWDISDAVLCTGQELEQASNVYQSLDDPRSRADWCGSSRPHAYQPIKTPDVSPQLSLEFNDAGHFGGSTYLAQFASLRDGRVITRVSPNSSTENEGLEIMGSGHLQARLPGTITLVWRSRNPETSLVFPFRGALSIGQDVTTTRHALLEEGQIDVYSASNEEASGRSLVDSINLLPGDKVEVSGDDGSAPASGFIRLTHEAMTTQWPQISVIAFGLSNHVNIERFGEAGIVFQPTFWARLTHNNWLVIFTLVLFGGLSILATLAEATRLIQRPQRQPKDPPQ